MIFPADLLWQDRQMIFAPELTSCAVEQPGREIALFRLLRPIPTQQVNLNDCSSAPDDTAVIASSPFLAAKAFVNGSVTEKLGQRCENSGQPELQPFRRSRDHDRAFHSPKHHHALH